MFLNRSSIKVGVSIFSVLLATVAMLSIAAPHTAQAQHGRPPRRSIGNGLAPTTSEIAVYVDRGDDNNVSTCSSAPNDCTLRGAINLANSDSLNYYDIYFTPTLTLITLTNPLPTINTANSPYIIGTGGLPRIDALSMANGDVFSINDNDVKISNLSIVNGHTAADGVYADIHVLTGTRNLIENNYIGTLRPADVHGGTTSCTPNPSSGLVSRNSIYGVWIDAGASGASGAGNGAAYIYGNTIGCHDLHGVVVNGPDYVYIGEDAGGITGTNYIGLNANSVPLTNTFDGIDILPNVSNSSRYDTIDHNYIGNNGRFGIYVHGNGTANSNSAYGITIKSNRIGRAPNYSPAGNGWDGILIDNAAFLDFIGGPNPGDGNAVESTRNFGGSNDGNGIYVLNSVGIGILGSTTAGIDIDYNAGAGIRIDGGHDNWVGGAVYGIIPATAHNYIQFNAGDGIQLVNGTHDNTVSNNSPSYNNLSGIAIFGGAYNNMIGGSTYTDTNYVYNNGVSGVSIADSTTTSNTLWYNSLEYNYGDNLTLQNNTHGNQIGGDTILQSNNIDRGAKNGISILNAHNNSIRDNYVFSNTYYGLILSGTNTYGNLITKTNIYSNGYDGIGEGNSAAFNVWSHVSIYGNGGLGVDKNASSDFTNIVDAPPVNIIKVVQSGSTTVDGTGPNGSLIELYAVAPDPSGFGEGKQFVGSAVVSSGQWEIIDPYGGYCYTTIEIALGIASTEFSANNCRTFLPLTLKNH